MYFVRSVYLIFERMKLLLSKYLLISLPLSIGFFILATGLPEAPSDSKRQKDIEGKALMPEAEIPWVEQQLASMTLREKIGQFFMVAAYSGKDESHFRNIDSLVVRDRVGGLIFFQGNRENLVQCIDRFQKEASVPLLVGMDAEWGVSMRLSGEDRFPYNYTLGAANDPELTKKVGQLMGQECRDLGIHLNFAPVADVNSNPNNPVIGFRSFGENPKMVAEQVAAAVEGMESQGVMTSIKHFPGHGDTDVDSHLELPVVSNSLSHIDAIDFFPFRSGIRAGAGSVMIGHLNVPALDSTGTPTSLSKHVIQHYLRDQMGFRGLVVSDALGMKAVANKYGKTEVVVKAFTAGCDILLFPESVGDAIDAIEKRVNEGKISQEEIDERCRRVLLAKYKYVIKPENAKKISVYEAELVRKRVYEKALTIIRNDEELLPFKRMDKRIAHVSIGGDASALEASMDLITPVDHFHAANGTEALSKYKGIVTNYDVVITSIHASSVLSRNDYGMPDNWRGWLKGLPTDKENVLLHFANPYVLGKQAPLDHLDAIVVAYENHKWMQDRAGQFIMGAFAGQGSLPVTVNDEFKRGRSISVAWGGKLKESQPEELGISRDKLNEIDAVVEKGIADGAFPGCQVLVAVDGKVIYNKSFGHHTYSNEQPVKPEDVYDIASITKVASSTLSLMHLESEGKFNSDGTLNDYLPELVGNSTSYGPMKIKDMLTHQAGLTPWIPFYTSTLKNYRPDPAVYAREKSEEFPYQVTGNMWIRKDYRDAMYAEILRTPLKAKTYKYSDLGYYFMKKIIESKGGKELDRYVNEEFYAPMGLRRILYNPLKMFPASQITPTEKDTIFRKQLVHGYVHDQGAAMMGGVAGHAGLFANARDLAAVFQLFLNGGTYGGVRYIKQDVLNKYTGCPYCPKNRRGIGFDKPSPDGTGGPVSSLVPVSGYGHSGFTGTLAWVDPEYKVNYIFLSNRVYPDAENWKIVKMNIRTEIHTIIYQAVTAAK